MVCSSPQTLSMFSRLQPQANLESHLRDFPKLLPKFPLP
ncbi:hypothetical protein CKA32_005398 [Geitlerinema sp. FC II]|nr:hypothetical protein CKA32_005398 [Geitlerinema sp. FC II]